uniref:AAA+ ATPase domain-containing protein n=1 Tax=Ciona savignyi TaxID=51511 RepID=H2ZKA8_CIOSA
MAEMTDPRWDFLQSKTLKTLNLKVDKWAKMIMQEESKILVQEFLDKTDYFCLLIYLTPAGQLNPSYEFPTSIKQKGTYFVKKEKLGVTKENVRTKLIVGDISQIPLDHMSPLVDEFLSHLLSNDGNHQRWPAVVSDDVLRHVHKLKSNVYVVAGHVKGKTLLPLPVGSEKVDNAKAEERRALLHAIETVVIDWSHQVRDVLKQESAQPLLEGKNPGPSVEIDFWNAKCTNLECIYNQLKTPKVKKMAAILELSHSSYYPALRDIFTDVVSALREARDIQMYLKPLRSFLDDFEQVDFTEAIPKLAPLMHIVCLIWSQSKCYNTPVRIIVLLREMCNFLIEVTCNFLSPEDILKGEVDESVEKVAAALKVLHAFRASFDDYKGKIDTFYEDKSKVKYWKFAPELVFSRMDNFINRLDIVMEFFVRSQEFMKLEKIEFGGVKGRVLSQLVLNIFDGFQDLYKVFGERTYNPLDPEDPAFEDDFDSFTQSLSDLERQLANIICQGFDDCSGMASICKMLNIFGSLLDRPIIKADFDHKYPILLRLFNTSLDKIKQIFDEHVIATANQPCVHKNQPPVAGQLKWVQELHERITWPMELLQHINHPVLCAFFRIFHSEECDLVFAKQEQMVKLIKEYENKIFEQWTSGVEEACKFNLGQPLLKRNPDTQLISVNFDPQLVAVLREVRYMKYLNRLDIPDVALELYENHEMFRKYCANLDLTVAWYNEVRNSVVDVEYPLVEGQLHEIDDVLRQAETQLCWKSEGIWEYIQATRDRVNDLQVRVQKTKMNIEKIEKIMKTWSETPLFERKQSNPAAILNLEDRKDRLAKRYAMIIADGEAIHQCVKENLNFFNAVESSEIWQAYISYLDDMVIDGFFNCIFCSLNYFMENTDPDVQPLFIAELELQSPDMVFRPSLMEGAPDGFLDLIEGLLVDIYKMSTLVPRIAPQVGQPDYKADMDDMAELAAMRGDLVSRVHEVIDKAIAYSQGFLEYGALWTDDRQEFMKQFLTYGHILAPEEVEMHGDEGVPETPPTLTQFKEQIDSYEGLYQVISNVTATQVFDSWFLVQIKPFKQALLNTVKRWSYMFKEHLINHVESSLSDLKEFIKVADLGLSKPIEEGDYDGLVECMGHLMAVRDRADATDVMFEPLKQTIELLKAYDQEMSEDVHLQLQELPEQWNNTRKLSVTVKQTVAPLQANEVSIIRRKCTSFDVKQHEFREKFRKELVFRFDCVAAYPNLDRMQENVLDLKTEMISLHESAGLFEVNVPDYKQLKACRREVGLCKGVWDLVQLVRTSTDDWKTTLWADINVEQMDIDCKRFAKDIRTLDKEARAWDVFGGLDSLVKNMITSLRAVGDLQNPAIRDRHWHELMQAAKVRFTMDETTTLADLLKLNLHNFEDEVREIVDKAVKEMGMEKTLRELDVTWAAMDFEYEHHQRTQSPLIKSNEELVETLEDNQVQLQNLMTSKYIAHFLEEGSLGWQKLSTADSVLTIWLEVQRTWSHLESIFIGSEDIRAQLPEDSKRFDGVDRDFKEIMADAVTTPNVIEATNKKGLYERLEDLQAKLTLCEKALAEYLETKRLAFPRFYFVSSSDLLDILSNGNNPVEVSRHLAKLFDNMSKLKFEEEEGGEASKSALGMYSTEDEYVAFGELCHCTGQVELWLNRVMDAMRATVRNELAEAVVTYEEKPRDQWLFDYPAQVALTSTQIWWSTEVGISFARLEEGYEHALKDYFKKQVQQLNTLIGLLIGSLTPNDRQKIMTICTIDVHARDVVAKLIQQKIESASEFVWQSQLRHRWDDEKKHCFANICDAQFVYSYEYLGNTPRLVITPLTDRCYITLTQSLHLIMGGAPAGPAGTGKTETTKDLARSLGIMVYVFNCSEQMDYKSIGNIYKGLAQTGAWGCFDEFNRISVEVLSVVAVQVKSIQDAIRFKKKRFIFQGEEISLIPTVGIFITMNPGYAGRTELPENLKALFRPCAMVVPDFELICEIMLVAEGFLEARILARKFITLYTLCKELLSKQDHYDWGLRAIKSVLVVAGSLKRSDKTRPEEQVLMRALRDFNIPKIVTDDMPVFMGLIGDLFPALDVPRKRDLDLEKMCRQAVHDLKLQAEDNFVLKLVQLDELLFVRHSVFVIGNAGTGKTQVLKSLMKCYQNMKRRPIWVDLNPKAVTNDELFGIINPATREWKDGLFSTVMRDLSNVTHNGPKWIVLDGDIDPMWIESLNTVMDDNKVLTLASNERIPLTPSMRLLFEISNLRTATPATVSRAGILYLNPADLGWNPVVTSWIDKREIQSEKANLTILFDKYIPACLETLRGRFKTITPIPECAKIQMLCFLLEVLLTPENTPADCPKELYELYFVFACIWAFGGAMFQDQLIDYRLVEFSKWWTTEFKTVKFPSAGTVFDYCIDSETKKFLPWSESVPAFELDPELPLQACMVPTAETRRIRYFMDLLMEIRRPVMLVGNAGAGKTVLVQDKLAALPDDFMVTNVPFNFYTTSMMLQGVLEKPLEKKAGRNFGPPGSKRLVYFIDDMNMPEVDAYGTVQPHTLIRQHMDYSHWYDRTKLILKDINNVQYVACMNPTAGSFTINPRLQRHFSVFAVSFPGQDALQVIYSSILTQHLQMGGFPVAVQKMSNTLVQAALALHAKINSTFLPTAIKFHYIFNLRDLSNIFQGILFSTSDCVKNISDLVRLWMHEASRVYCDKLIDQKDIEMFEKNKLEFAKKYFDDIPDEVLTAEPLLFCHFSAGIGDPKYLAVSTWQAMNKLLVDGLEAYNEVNAVMNLVLFEDAMSHIARINRILESPRGNALLVGVGGSGKQSLSRLAAFISGLEVFQITLRKGYGIPDLKVDLGALCIKAGLKNIGTMFLLTDAQVPDEKFLVLVNDLLASGEIPELLPEDEVENVISGVRNEVKGAGLEDTRENCWKFFIDRVRRQLKVVLCFSPVGSTLRVRGRKFPAVVNCTQIDWFHEWPEEALQSVSLTFLQDIEGIDPEIKPSISQFMSYVHTSVNQTSKMYLANDRRYNYTTPKSFLEQIKLYESLLGVKGKELQAKMERLENGLTKLQSTAAQVDDLKAKLASQEVELQQKNEDADKLIHVVGIETEKVSKEKAIADNEENKVAVFAVEVGEKQKSCETDLAKAEPALAAAQEALNTLNKNNLTELKSFGSPPGAVVNVTAAVMVLLAPNGKVPKDRSWKASKVMMAKVDAFLEQLINYDKENIHENSLKAIRPYLDDPEFDYDFIKQKSGAAAGLCAWCINIVRFYEVYCDVEPKRIALSKANSDLAAAQDKLSGIKAKIAQLDANLAELTAKFEKATSDKLKCQQEAESTTLTINLANRLVGGLASENVRWAEAVSGFKEQEKMLCGDILLITAFVSYVGYFTRSYRIEFMDQCWLPYMKKQEVPIPTTEGLDPLSMLTDDADIAEWNNEGLPSDRMSTENATILTNCQRWPLIVDPQLQGIQWIKRRYSNLKIVRLGQRGYLDVIEMGVSNGDTVFIENVEESVDPVLEPLLGRNTIKKGRYIKIGDKEVEYHPSFRLILHTKLANPHYQPEMQAQCTLINFTVTKDGLEEQLLAEVVRCERPDLEELKAKLTLQQNDFKITLKRLEDSLLSRLSAASGNFLGDTALVENLETTKKTAAEIEIKVAEAKVTETKINEAREGYRVVALRASLLYFILNDLNIINPIYQFSLKAFNVVFSKAIERSEQSDDLKVRVSNLVQTTTYSVFQYTTRGLFECDKLTFTAQVALQILLANKEINLVEMDFLLRFPVKMDSTSPVDFLSNYSWGGIKVLSEFEDFRNLDRDIEGSAKRWKKFAESECPEKEKFPQEWKNKSSLQKLCMMRALRPDRMTYAVQNFVEEKLGTQYVENRSVEFAKSYEESGPETPIFFVLSPGVNPLKDVEAIGVKLGFTMDKKNFHNVSLGQGQEIVAEQALDLAAQEGHWVVLQNVHLVAKWLSTLEKKIEKYSIGSHKSYRVYVSAEPAATRDSHIIPQGILESSIKITNEPPTGMQANLHKALDNFNQETLEMCSRETEFKSLLQSLCYFHAVLSERKKFGPQGWNRPYPFNVGDLTISVNVLFNYLEANSKVPWNDLRYLFCEIMYGGHITDDWDRKLCKTYLEVYMHPDQLEGELLLAPGYPVPPNMDYKGYHEYIDEVLPPESPYLYGLHPNAEIGVLTTTSENLFRTLLEMQPKDAAGAGGGGATREEKVKALLDEILEKLPEEFNIVELLSKVEDRTPYIVVAFQECERMNILTKELRQSLKQLDLGLKGELTITSDMEELESAMFFDSVPESWTKRAYPSMFGLTAWFADLLIRIKELESWTADFQLPNVVWLGGLFNPQSFLTAIMQSMARKNEWPLDKMCLQCDATKKNKEDFNSPPREGSYIHGLFMEGARWDVQSGLMAESRLKELTPAMPVMFIKAIPVDRQETKNIYECPVYKNKSRGPTYVWTFNLKTKEKSSKWILAGVALLLQV